MHTCTKPWFNYKFSFTCTDLVYITLFLDCNMRRKKLYSPLVFHSNLNLSRRNKRHRSKCRESKHICHDILKQISYETERERKREREQLSSSIVVRLIASTIRIQFETFNGITCVYSIFVLNSRQYNSSAMLFNPV